MLRTTNKILVDTADRQLPVPPAPVCSSRLHAGVLKTTKEGNATWPWVVQAKLSVQAWVPT